MNPYQTPKSKNSEASTSEILRSHPPVGSASAMFLWWIGTFFFSLLIVFDLLVGTKLPGSMVYVALLLGPILGVLGAIATKYERRAKICLIIATLFLLPIQFVVTGIVLLATTGFGGIH